MKFILFFSLFFTYFSEAYSTVQKIKSKRVECLIKAYPDFFCSVKGNILKTCQGQEWVYQKGMVHKKFQEKLKDPSLKDQMELFYPKGKVSWPLPLNFDPGRMRYEPFFRKFYGSSRKEVEKNIVSVPWLPTYTKKTLRVTKIHGVDKKLRAISSEIEKLPEKIRKHVYNPQGGFHWRVIKGTKRLSMHSFGVAVDLFPPSGKSYWKLSHPDKNKLYAYKNTFPLEIVSIFEKHGFIWGGKWYHFDSLHFEYRPELLLDNCQR